MTRPVCTIVVPVFNNCFYTRLMFASLRETRAESPSFRLVVVDNGSTDETVELVESSRDLVDDVVRNDENRGFAAACNQGASLGEGKYLLFLNNDVVAQPGWLAALVHTAESDERIGIVGARLLYPSGAIQHAGVVFGADGNPRHAYAGCPAQHPPALKTRDVQAVTGACLLVERRLFESIGRFDEEFQNSFEDIDLCLRVRDRGRRVVYCPDAVLYHFESVTPGRMLRVDLSHVHFVTRWRDRVTNDVGDALDGSDGSHSDGGGSLQVALESARRRIGEIEEASHEMGRLVALSRSTPTHICPGLPYSSTPEIRAKTARMALSLKYVPSPFEWTPARARFLVPVVLVNNGSSRIEARRLDLSYHWRHATDPRHDVFDGPRTTVEADLDPGESITVYARVEAPLLAGSYWIEWDAVEEWRTWLSWVGVPTRRQFVSVDEPRGVVAIVRNLPLVIRAGDELDLTIHLARVDGLAPPADTSLLSRWRRTPCLEVDPGSLPKTPTDDAGAWVVGKHVKTVVPSESGAYWLEASTCTRDGHPVRVPTIGGGVTVVHGSTIAKSLASAREESRGCQDPAFDFGMSDPGYWRFRAEEAEYAIGALLSSRAASSARVSENGHFGALPRLVVGGATLTMQRLLEIVRRRRRSSARSR